MSVALVSRPAMPGYKNTPDLDEAHTLPSDYSYPQTTMSHTPGLYGYTQTEPSADLLHGSWPTSSAEPRQAFQDYADRGSPHSGTAEEYMVTSGQTTPRGSRMDRTRAIDGTWTAAGLTPASSRGHPMSRVDSSRSTGSSLSQSSHLSNMDIRGNASAFRNGSQASSAMVGADSLLLMDSDGSTMPQGFWPGYNLGGTGLDVESGPFSVADPDSMHVVPSQMQFGPDVSLQDTSSPSPWLNFAGPISRNSSPAAIDEAWMQAQRPLSPPNSSPDIHCNSPSLDVGSQMKQEDINGNGMSQLPESMTLSSSLGNRREGETARNHDLYKSARPQDDGLFHCPWEGDPSCTHKPEKLKCNYDKYVDSHLKPYRCKDIVCDGARFSSTACLLRHEREAHGLHGHGEKPFLCHYDGCERGVPGNGFPRQWNLKDHMRRVHNDNGNSAGPSPGDSVAQPSTKSRKRKTSDGSENRSSSNRKSSSTQKNMAVKESRQHRPTAKPLLEQWMDRRRAIEEMMGDLNRPDDNRTVAQIAEIQEHLSTLMQMTVEFNPQRRQNGLPHVVERMDMASTG